MKELSCDLHIVGGALTGLLTAYCVSHLGYKIIVSERKNINLHNKKPTTDTRTTAIAEGSKVFLETNNYHVQQEYTTIMAGAVWPVRPASYNINGFNSKTVFTLRI